MRAVFNLSTRVNVRNDFFDLTVGESTGCGRDVGEAFRDAFTKEMARLAFERSGLCSICCSRAATLVTHWDGPTGRGCDVRCEQCAKMAFDWPAGWQPIPAAAESP